MPLQFASHKHHHAFAWGPNDLLRLVCGNKLTVMQPLASSRGRGIRLVPDPGAIPAEKACLVQHYVSNPHTINGLKVCCPACPTCPARDSRGPVYLALLCPALPCPALPCAALPCHAAFLRLILMCSAPPCSACPALPCPAMLRPALPRSTLQWLSNTSHHQQLCRSLPPFHPRGLPHPVPLPPPCSTLPLRFACPALPRSELPHPHPELSYLRVCLLFSANSEKLRVLLLAFQPLLAVPKLDTDLRNLPVMTTSNQHLFCSPVSSSVAHVHVTCLPFIIWLPNLSSMA